MDDKPTIAPEDAAIIKQAVASWPEPEAAARQLIAAFGMIDAAVRRPAPDAIAPTLYVRHPDDSYSEATAEYIAIAAAALSRPPADFGPGVAAVAEETAPAPTGAWQPAAAT